MSDSLVGTAIAFARRGHGVFPVCWPQRINGAWCCSCGQRTCRNAAKHPYAPFAPTGVKSASTDPDIIRRWFERAPRANLAVSTARLVVIDIDPRHGGDETFAALEREHEFPPTWQVLTGAGGMHVYFCCPAGVEIASTTAESNPLLGPGLDVRARGGYVVAPPSRHINGRAYCWSVDFHPADVPLAEAPAWLIAKLLTPADDRGAATPPEVWERLVGDTIREYADAAAASVAGHLLRRWVDPYLAAGLLHAWNQVYVQPPLPDDELRRILDRIARLEDQRRDAQGGKHA
jgi:hypothetical protein